MCPSQCVVCVKDKKGEYIFYNVPYDVYIYIKQLESKVKYPNLSKLTELYPDLKPSTM